MPRIGLRNIKTAIAVFLCLALFIVLMGIDYLINGSFIQATKWYTPFFASIAAAYSVAPNKESSLKQAKVRIIASIIGGLFGIAIVFIYTKLFNKNWPFSQINAFGKVDYNGSSESFILSFIFPAILVLLSSVFVIYICLLTKQKNAAFVSVLTLTAVMCSLGTDPIIYGFNRILSTIIGVLFALAVNLFHIPHHKNVNDLYVVGIDGIYSTDDKKVDGYINYTLNNLAYYKANICLFTTKTPTTLIPMFNNVKLNAPILCMSGAALYDTNNKKYLYEEKIKSDVANKIRNSLEEKGITPIVNLIDENVLYTYCECANNEMMKVYFDERRNSAYSCFVPHKAPYADVLYMVLIVKNDRVDNFLTMIKEIGVDDQIKILMYDFYSLDGVYSDYKYIKIYNKNITKLNALDYINNNGKKVGIITDDNASHLALNVDYCITTQSNVDNCSQVIKKNNAEFVFRKLKHLFFKRNKE